MKLVFMGDLAGHQEEFYSALVELGAHPETLQLPDDVHVVQVGDLIHRGPNNKGVLNIVENLLNQNKLTQLLGNHEALYLKKANFYWQEELDAYDQGRLKSWFKSGDLKLAGAFDTKEYGPLFVSHAGMTRGVWFRVDKTTDPATAARLLNTDPDGRGAYRGGAMILGKSRADAGLIWASAGEVAGLWLHYGGLPFSQIHGHSSLYWWDKNVLTFNFTTKPSSFRVDTQKRHTFLETETGKTIIGIDPGFGAKPRPWSPLILEGEVLV